MSRYAMFFLVLVLLATLNGPQVAMSQKADPTIVDFRIQALYRAAKLTWTTRDGLKDQLSVQILRAVSFEEGPYKEVDVIKLIPGKKVYEYVDKTMGAESKYYYKLFVKETGEYFGPIPTRPYFSPPATKFQSPEDHGLLLALREATR